MHRPSLAIVPGALAALALLAHATRLQQGSTWSIDFDDPNRDGSVTVTLEVSYSNAQGTKQRKSVAATVNVDDTWDATTKKTNVQNALNAELDKDANKVGNQSVATTGGTGDVMTATPAADSAGNFSNMKIEKLTVKDKDTHEKDEVRPPAQSEALAEIQPVGDITGSGGDASAGFSVGTNAGVVTVGLSAGMRKMELLDQLKAGLTQQGAKSWVDYDRNVLYVRIDGTTITGVSAGCNDRGLASSCVVIGY